MSSHPPRSGPAPAMFRPHGETGIANTLRLTSPPLLLLGRSSPISLSLTSLATEFDAFFIRPLLSLSRRPAPWRAFARTGQRSEEHTSELQSLMRISYAVFCLKKKKHLTYPLTCNHDSHIIIKAS